jgi:hypothetical protein
MLSWPSAADAPKPDYMPVRFKQIYSQLFLYNKIHADNLTMKPGDWCMFYKEKYRKGKM